MGLLVLENRKLIPLRCSLFGLRLRRRTEIRVWNAWVANAHFFTSTKGWISVQVIVSGRSAIIVASQVYDV